MKHAERLLRKVKLNNSGTATITWKDYYVDADTGERSRNDVDHPGEQLIHGDFRAAFAKLNEHWLIRGEETPEPKSNYPFDASLKNLERVTVTSVTFSGGEPVDPESGEERTAVAAHIQGTMTLKGGGVKNFCLPAIKMGAPAEKYRFATHLDQHLAAIEREVWDYASGIKFAPPKEEQTAMSFEGAGGDQGSGDILAIGAGSPATDDGEDHREAAREAANTTPLSVVSDDEE